MQTHPKQPTRGHAREKGKRGHGPRLIGLGATLLGIGCAMSAHAASVSGTAQTSLAAPDPGSSEWPAVLELPLFDSTLGTLTGIEFSLYATFSGNAGFENQQPGAVNTVDYATTLQAQFLLPTAGSPSSLDLSLSGSSGVLGPSDGVPDFGGTSGASVSLGTDQQTSTVPILPADFAAYTTPGVPGTFQVTVSADLGQTLVSGNGAKAFAYVDQLEARARVGVTYFYQVETVIPEGRGIAAGAGLLALVAISGVGRLGRWSRDARSRPVLSEAVRRVDAAAD